jgi:hypothetical protein
MVAQRFNAGIATTNQCKSRSDGRNHSSGRYATPG